MMPRSSLRPSRAGILLSSLASVVAAQGGPAPPARPAAVILDFSNELVGAEPRSMVPVVGFWGIAEEAGNKVLVIDGRSWKDGQPSANLAEKARSLYGERYAEFLDNVQAYSYFPYAVAAAVDGFSAGEISLRFKAIGGRIDQAAGILFNLKPNGDYLALRANPLENNLVLWQFVRGKRSSVKWIRNTETSSGAWHTLRLQVIGTKVNGFIDDKLYLEHSLGAPVLGRVGVWSKADSHVYVDDFRVTPAR
jgi:hypothetical protein